MEWVALTTALLSFCLCVVTYNMGYRKGYRTGARNIIAQWRKTLEELGELDND